MLNQKNSQEEGINNFKKWAEQSSQGMKKGRVESQELLKKMKKNEWLKLATEGNRNK